MAPAGRASFHRPNHAMVATLAANGCQPHPRQKLLPCLCAALQIGIVGRTGSGKTTLLMALFRMINLAAGRIIMDGQDIGALPLREVCWGRSTGCAGTTLSASPVLDLYAEQGGSATLITGSKHREGAGLPATSALSRVAALYVTAGPPCHQHHPPGACHVQGHCALQPGPLWNSLRQ